MVSAAQGGGGTSTVGEEAAIVNKLPGCWGLGGEGAKAMATACGLPRRAGVLATILSLSLSVCSVDSISIGVTFS